MGPSQICECPFREPRVFTITRDIYPYFRKTPYVHSSRGLIPAYGALIPDGDLPCSNIMNKTHDKVSCKLPKHTTTYCWPNIWNYIKFTSYEHPSHHHCKVVTRSLPICFPNSNAAAGASRVNTRESPDGLAARAPRHRGNWAPTSLTGEGTHFEPPLALKGSRLLQRNHEHRPWLIILIC